MAWKQMSTVKLQDKEKILGHKCEVPSTRLYDSPTGIPLFWAERKTKEFWLQLLQDLDVAAVFDLTPGTGTLAKACLDASILYSGMPRNADHRILLDHWLDRYALSCACTPQTSIFTDDLAAQIREHFGDIVDFRAEQQTLKDEEAPDAM